MPIDTSIYQNLKQAEMPSFSDAQGKAMNLSNLAMQNQSMANKMQTDQKDAQYSEHMRKASVIGNALESISGLSPQERALKYPQVRGQLIQSGMISEQDAPAEYDDGLYSQTLAQYQRTKPALENELLRAQVAKAKFDSKGDPLNQELTKSQIAKNYADAKKTKGEAGEGKVPTQSQFTAATFGTRAQQAENVFSELAKKGYDPTTGENSIKRKLPGFLEGFKDEDTKRQAQAERNFVNAILRRESGAAISPSEFESSEKQYFARHGDTPEVLKQKELNRKTAQAALNAEGAPAMGRIAQSMDGMEIGTSVPVPSDNGLIPSANADVQNKEKKPSSIIMRRNGKLKEIPIGMKGAAIADGWDVVK